MGSQNFQIPSRVRLEDGGRIVIIGGGPAGAFCAIHLLRRAQALHRDVRVTILERRCRSCPPGPCCPAEGWKGCNYCAGGISPKLSDTLNSLDLTIPPDVIQNRIHQITIQGYWKNIELEVPAGREMLSVFRGARPARRQDSGRSFDAYLLDAALARGAELISGEVHQTAYSPRGRPTVVYRAKGSDTEIEADFVVFAAGVNEVPDGQVNGRGVGTLLRQLIPDYEPPRLRRALILELEARAGLPPHLEGELYFVEYGSHRLHLEMCSLVPKRGFITVVLLGGSVDTAATVSEHREIVQEFLALPHVRKLVPRTISLRATCVCNPNMVVGSARHPFGERVAAIGDLVTSRLYKDGIFTAHQTAQALATTLLEQGLDAGSLRTGYLPAIQRLERDNQFAARVFLVHRLVFGSSVLSRIFYQAVISERKAMPGPQRRLDRILWRIASGDDQYEDIYRSMRQLAVVWSIFTGGILITARNYFTELLFGLPWEGFGRFPTGVAIERFEAKRTLLGRAMAEGSLTMLEQPEFERMYTIKIRARRAQVLEQLEEFGEPDRRFMHPRWVRIHRIAGQPHEPGCVIEYVVGSRPFCFHLVLERIVGEHLAVYRVQDGFARGGVLIFEIEKLFDNLCALSIYVAFNFKRGRSWATRPFWWLFRRLFPAFVHDVIWNHSLCQFKDVVEEAE